MGYKESEGFISVKTKFYMVYVCPACGCLTYKHKRWEDTTICNTPICVWRNRYIVNLRTGLSYVYATFKEAQDFMGRPV